ncbi:aromatic ring-hydroxylating oxygenase subunit alpha [Sphingomonas profundi]|uniref:aromatic ring-hydroxylating oxygenase subunit alpha n=1 Tax=Alterirhizorhabdus profundi TaxID=2681549 RepID=UPI0018D1ADC9|nr:aromatic ring-hydroxylating dioxygenase subunit alpha [Sphingomonas profundi]
MNEMVGTLAPAAEQPDREVARAPSASTQELIHRDGRPVPPVFEESPYRFLGDGDIAYDRYTSQAFFDLEMERMWSRTWQWACREEHIPEPGDWIVYDIGDKSVLVVRGDDGEVRAFINSCMHRGTKLRRSATSGHSSELRCPFHGWTWSLEGDLKRLPCRWDAPHVSEQTHGLDPVRIGLWGGLVFINLDRDAPPLDDYLQPLQRHFAPYGLEKRYIEMHIEKELFCNWKAGIEAFIENYHTQETHPQLLTANADEGTQYDLFTPIVTRFVSANGMSSPHLEEALGENELIESMLIGARSMVDDDLLKVGEGESARIVLARVMRDVLGRVYRTDLSRYTDTEIIDVAQYSVFPNMILFPGLTLPALYRFRPIGNDPDRCLFELLILREPPADGPTPEPAEPIRLTEEQSYAEAGLDPFLAHIYDQDTGNLRAQQEGFKASRKQGQTLLNYQEARVRLLHQTLDAYLDGETPLRFAD